MSVGGAPIQVSFPPSTIHTGLDETLLMGGQAPLPQVLLEGILIGTTARGPSDMMGLGGEVLA